MEFNQDYINILKYLQPYGIGITTDISGQLQKIFPLPDKNDSDQLIIQAEKVKAFVNSLIGNIWLQKEHAVNHRIGKVRRGEEFICVWLDDIQVLAHITSNGLSFLNNIESQGLSEKVGNSVLTTNKAVTKLSNTQNKLYFITLIIAVLGVLFPGLSYLKDYRVSALNKTINVLNAKINDDSLNIAKLKHIDDSLSLVLRVSHRVMQKVN